jgi:hypothetical protein
MNPICAIGRLACILAGLAIAFAATAPAALAIPRPLPPGWNKHPPLPAGPQPAVRFPPGWNKHPPLPAHAHALAAAGMPVWQVTLIAAAALLTAALAVTGYRILAARRRATPGAA